MLTLFAVILKNKKLVVIVTAAAFVLSAGVSLVLPQRFVSMAAFMPAGVEKDITGLRDFFSSLGELGTITATFVRASKNLVIEQLIRSRRMSDLMDEQFDLRSRYGVRSADEVNEELREHTGVLIKDEGMIILSVEDSDPGGAMRMVEAYLVNLDSLLIGMVVESSEGKARFLREEIARHEARIAETDSAISAFQEEYGIYHVEAQAQAALNVAAALSARLMIVDVEKNLLEMTMKPGAADLEAVLLEWELLEKQLLELKEGSPDGGRLFPPLDDLADLSYRYAHLLIEKKVQEFMLAYLRLQYIDAEVSSGRGVSTMKVIDPPYRPQRRSWPKRKQIVMAATFAAFIGVSLLLMVREQWKKGALAFDAYPDEEPAPADAGEEV